MNLDEARLKLKLNNVKCQIISSNQEADKLELENYKFRSYPTNHNNGLTTYSLRLNQGAIAFCTFVRDDFAAITWVIPSQYVQDRIKTLPIKVGYSNHEAFARGAWVNPKYRKLGVYGFTISNRDKFLTGLGINVLWNAIETSNETGQALQRTVGSIKSGRGRLVRILFWKFWRQTPEDKLAQYGDAYLNCPHKRL